MANDEVLNRAAEVNEQLRPIELTAESVTRPAGPHTPQKTWVAEGSVEREERADIAWVEENRSLFSD